MRERRIHRDREAGSATRRLSRSRLILSDVPGGSIRRNHNVLTERARDLSLPIHSFAVTAMLNKTFNRAAGLVIDLPLS